MPELIVNDISVTQRIGTLIVTIHTLENSKRIVPTLCVGMHPATLQRCVKLILTEFGTLERPELHSHAERGNDTGWSE